MRSSASSSTASGPNSQVFAAAIADFEMQVYGAGRAPLYDLITTYGSITCMNTLDSSFQSFDETREILKEGDAGFSYSEEFNQFTLALRVPGGGIVFAGLLHDKDGSPRVDEQLVLCRVMANRNFDLEGRTIISKGQEFIKALPESYLSKMEKAA